ncbi:hypothetical protein B0H19DRAFT_1066562 [Mycena capillaripes]|nr:hypothetical protein B0H19DRAFT_1066562 [Mycena capillaripes]
MDGIMIVDDVLLARDQEFAALFDRGSHQDIQTVILIYDSFLTLDAEVKYIWVHGQERGTAWFLFLRCCAFWSNIVQFLIMFGNFDPQTCNKFNLTHGIVLVVQQLAVGYLVGNIGLKAQYLHYDPISDLIRSTGEEEKENFIAPFFADEELPFFLSFYGAVSSRS